MMSVGARRGKAGGGEAERAELRDWRAGAEATRRARWQEYAAGQMQWSCGKVYKRAQRSAAEPGLTQLKPLSEGEEQTLGDRARQAAHAWHGVWSGGSPWEGDADLFLPANTLTPVAGLC